jgi:hypothetical protein
MVGWRHGQVGSAAGDGDEQPPARSPTRSSTSSTWLGWVCVTAAWLGRLLSLTVLAVPAFKDHDGGARWSPAQPPRGCTDPGV